ncbi:hypothetical protein ABN028_24410 [Actinopolymorpha sp. B17G11]
MRLEVARGGISVERQDGTTALESCTASCPVAAPADDEFTFD